MDIKDFVRIITLETEKESDKIIPFDEKSFFKKILVFNLCWKYKHNATWSCRKNLWTLTIVELLLNSDCKRRTDWNDVGQPFMNRFGVDKAASYKKFVKPKTVPFKKSSLKKNYVLFQELKKWSRIKSRNYDFLLTLGKMYKRKELSENQN